MAELGARPKYNREVKIIGTYAQLKSCVLGTFKKAPILEPFNAYPICN